MLHSLIMESQQNQSLRAQQKSCVLGHNKIGETSETDDMSKYRETYKTCIAWSAGCHSQDNAI